VHFCFSSSSRHFHCAEGNIQCVNLFCRLTHYQLKQDIAKEDGVDGSFFFTAPRHLNSAYVSNDTYVLTLPVSELRVFGAGRLLQDEEEVTGLSLPTLIYLIVLLLTDACRVHCRCCVCQLRFCAVSRCNDNCIFTCKQCLGGP
jgi:hypothetical protein